MRTSATAKSFPRAGAAGGKPGGGGGTAGPRIGAVTGGRRGSATDTRSAVPIERHVRREQRATVSTVHAPPLGTRKAADLPAVIMGIEGQPPMGDAVAHRI